MSSSKSKRLLIINRADLVANLLPANDNSNVSSHQMRTLRLHHSKSKELRPFLVVADQIFELVAYSPELGSVFIDDYVQSECSICLASRFDFVYFLISMSRSAKDEYNSLEKLKDKLIELSSADSSKTEFFKNHNKMPCNLQYKFHLHRLFG